MSHLQYYAYEGVGTTNRAKFSYSQAVRVGDRIECAGQGTSRTTFREKAKLASPPSLHFPPSVTHIDTDEPAGGWDPKTGEFEREINKQIDLAFENVERCLRDAGGKGWSQVFRVNSYHVPINDEALAAMVRNMRKWMPDHQPLWTCVGVSRLGEDDMRVEVEVVAHDPKN